MRRELFLALAIANLAGCGGNAAKRSTPPAAQGVNAYISVLRSGDPADAYALLSDEVKAEVDFETFALQWNESAPERAGQARALEESMQGSADLGERAAIVYADGKTVYLVRENGAWRLETAVISRIHAGQPIDAVEMFAMALDKRDYKAALRILTERRRQGIHEQVHSFVDSLLARIKSKKAAIETIGKDRAEMRWDDGKRRYKIILRKESGEWRVDDVHLRPVPSESDDDPE